MHPELAAPNLSDRLDSAGFDFDAADPAIAWETFKRFGKEPVEGVSEGFLWEIGCFNFTGESQFLISMVRQFTFSDGDDYDHTEQLSLKLFCAPTPQLQAVERAEWSFDHASPQQFFQFVESLPEFSVAQTGAEWYAELTQDCV